MRDRPHRLLIYGLDPLLLETRHLILKSGGYNADIVGTEQRFAGSLGRSSPYKLAIICYTLSDDERAAAHVIADRAGVPVWQLESLVSPPTFLAEVSRCLADFAGVR